MCIRPAMTFKLMCLPGGLPNGLNITPDHHRQPPRPLHFWISESNSKIHPFETFHLSMDDHKYSRFESTIICPSIRATHYHNALFANSFLTELPITFALGCQSIVDTKCFLVNTDYNHLPINIHPPSLEQTTPMPQVIPLDSTFTHSMHERFATPRKLNLTKLF